MQAFVFLGVTTVIESEVVQKIMVKKLRNVENELIVTSSEEYPRMLHRTKC